MKTVEKAFVSAFIASIFLFFISNNVMAAIWASDSNGVAVQKFYDNETIYVASDDITDGSAKQIRIYIIANKDTWLAGDVLTDVSNGYMTITTNSTGQTNTSSYPAYPIWNSPSIGTYDVVADINSTGKYNGTFDYVDAIATVGFEVIESPKPKLTISEGSSSPESHEWDPLAESEQNIMLQFNATAGYYESIRMNSIILMASGTGNDKNDIQYVNLVHDKNNNGQYDDEDDSLGFKEYLRDDDIITIGITDGFEIVSNDSTAFMIVYLMGTSAQGGTYKFDISIVNAVGMSSGEIAETVGLPLGSAVKTTSEPTTTTTTTTTTTLPTDECETNVDCPGVTCNDKMKSDYSCEFDSAKGVNVCASTIETVLCCAEGDCVEGYYCSNYACVKEGGAAALISNVKQGGKVNYLWTGTSIVIILGLVVVIFFVIRNQERSTWKHEKSFIQNKREDIVRKIRGRKPWKTDKDYSREWEELRKKWKKDKK